MSRPAPALISLLLLAAAACASEDRVTRLLDHALGAKTLEQADERLAEAREVLDGARSRLDEQVTGFLDADIVRARGQVYLKFAQGAPKEKRPGLRQTARQNLRKAHQAYQDLMRESEKRLEDIWDAFKGEDVTKSRKWQDASRFVSRARYQLAWQAYRLGDLTDADAAGQQRRQWFTEALKGFSYFTSTGQIKHPVVFDCFLGQSLCFHELGRHDELIESLEADFKIGEQLRGARADSSRRDSLRRMLYLLVKAYGERAGNSPSAKLEAAAAKYFDFLRPTHEHDALDLEAAVIRAENLHRLIQADDPALKDEAADYRRDLDAMAGLVELYGDPWLTRLDKALGRPASRTASRELKKARTLFNGKKYQEAIQAVDDALGDARVREKMRPSALATLRYVKAAAAWNLQDWLRAHRAAADFVHSTPKDRRAGDMCRRALQAGIRALKAEPPLPRREFDRFVRFARTHFPDEPEAQKAPWYRAQGLLEGEKYRDAERVLQGIPRSDPLYRHAQYGLALAAYRQAETALEKRPAAARVALERAATAIRRFTAAAPTHFLDEQEKLAKAVAFIAHATARGWLSLPEPKPQAALQLLDLLDENEELRDVEPGRRLALRLEAKMVGTGLEETWTLVEEYLGESFVEPHTAQAIARIAERLEDERETQANEGNADQAADLDRKLLRVYTFLREQIMHRTDEGAVRQKLNLRRRIARVHLRLDQPKDALPHLKWVLAKWPEGKPLPADMLRGLALGYEAVGRHDLALDRWQTLVRGVKPKTPEWYEAYFHWIKGYAAQKQTARARKLVDYLKLRYGEVEDPTWKPRFQAIEKKLGEDSPSEATAAETPTP